MAVKVRTALAGRDGHDSGSSLSGNAFRDSNNLLSPQNLANDVAFGDKLGAPEARGSGRLLSSGIGRRGRSRGGGGRRRGSRGRRALGLLLKDIARQGRGLVRGLGARLVGLGLGVGLGIRGLAILVGDLDITREDVGGTLDVVADNAGQETLLHLARSSLTLANNVEQRTVLNAARGVGAGVNSALEELLIPAHHKVSVVAEPYSKVSNV